MTGTCAEPGTTLAAWTFTYDGDGTRVKQVYTESAPQGYGSGTLTTYYFPSTALRQAQGDSSGHRFGGAYEVRTDGSTTVTLKYYSFGGQTILRDADGLKYMLTDHLGSVVAVTDASGALLSQTRYLPFGLPRTDVDPISQTDLTDFTYTGQRANSYIKLYDYGSRWYDPLLGRFLQPDVIIPDATNPAGQSLENAPIVRRLSGTLTPNVSVLGYKKHLEKTWQLSRRY